MRRASSIRRLAKAIPALAIMAALANACVSVGEGEGAVRSDHLIAADCWNDSFDLQPDFFAAEPGINQLDIRVQRGSDLSEVSDGLILVVDDVDWARDHRGEELSVSLPQGVAPPGIPIGALCPNGSCLDSHVHAALYLLESCHNENVVLYALSGTITFDELWSGDPDEKDAAEKLSVAHFKLKIGDPRSATKSDDGTYTVPDQSELEGYFRFYFQRGQPAQPFP